MLGLLPVRTLATCPNNEPQFKRLVLLEDQGEIEISFQCFEGIALTAARKQAAQKILLNNAGQEFQKRSGR